MILTFLVNLVFAGALLIEAIFLLGFVGLIYLIYILIKTLTQIMNPK